MPDINPLSPSEFEAIYHKVPRLTVEIILQNDGAVFLTKRAIEPCQGQWHLPGGTVRFGETLVAAVERVAQRELGIRPTETRQSGYIEYPSHYLHGLDSPVGIVFVVTAYAGTIKINTQADIGKWFNHLPTPMHADQDVFLIANGYLGVASIAP